ncbi:nitrogenase molybdenum-iron protein beta chain [ANME-1 cluster archaeon GoMg1]|nr:nitrogenase molybdenum-iron protein beta chain [ANME-1 cluster archaeon GoMg1]
MIEPIQGCRAIGALRAFHGVKDCVSILHSRPGCYCGMMLLRALYDQSDMRVACSGMHEKDVVHGAEDRIAKAIKKVDELYKPKLIACLSCCAPTIIGDDVGGVIESLRRKVSSEIVYLSCGGFESVAWVGYEDAIAKLVAFMKKEKKVENSVNLIGFHSDVVKSSFDLKEIKRMLNACDVSVLAVLTDSRFEEIKRAPNAALNVVLSGDGVKAAQIMEKEFATPYIILDYPYGLNQSVEFLEKICKELGKKTSDNFIEEEKSKIKEMLYKIHLYLQGISGTPVAVIGEASRAISLTKFLWNELSLDPRVVAITDANYVCDELSKDIKKYAQKVLVEPDKYEMSKTIEDSGVEIIFGSSFDKKISHRLGVPFIKFSYPIIDEVSLSDAPYAGFRGVPTLIEKVLNTVLNSEDGGIET